MFDYLLYIYLIVACFVGWKMLSRLQQGFTIFAPVGDYIYFKTVLSALLGIPLAPFYVVYAIIKADSDTERKILLACVAVFVIAIPIAHFYDESKKVRRTAPVKTETRVVAPVKKETTTTPNVKKEEQPLIVKGAPLSFQDFNLNGIQLGQSINDVIAEQGQPLSKEQTNYGMGYGFKNAIVVANDQGKVIIVAVEGDQMTTRRDTYTNFSIADEIIKAYGNSFQKAANGNLDLYEYEMAGNDGKWILQFAIDQNLHFLKYISMRIAE